MRFSGKAAYIKGLTDALTQQSQGPINIFPILLVDTGMQRIYIPARQVADVTKEEDLSRYETFDIPQRRKGGKMVQRLGRVVVVKPFDKFGRRAVTLSTARGPLNIIQGVTKITPKYLRVTGLTVLWEHGVAITSIEPKILDDMIRQVTDQKNPNDRMAIARFYIQASLLQQADAELTSIARDFPDYKNRVEEVSLELRQLQAKQLLAELRRRQAAGQHRLAYEYAKRFPVKNMSAAVLREVRELIAEYDQALERVDMVRGLLGDLPSQLEDPKRTAALKPLRSVVDYQLKEDYESLERLDAFLKQSGDESRTPAEKLALAYSGWVLGSANAIDDLETTLRLWDARVHVIEYLRTEDSDPKRRKQLLAQLNDLEGVGPQRIRQLIPLLPAPLQPEPPDIAAGEALTVEVTAKDAEVPVSYSALLPTEYPTKFTPHHRYPLIVALRPAERSTKDELLWWGGTKRKPGQSQRHGYVVIAPEYAEEKQRKYDGDAQAHYIVLQSIRDARKRFHIDSDRIFLAGHGMGGDAAFDIGMSHPDVFAGVIPIAGITGDLCKWYWQNSKHLAWYVVSGEYCRDSRARNATVINRMMRYGHNIIYTEYIGRGYESYYAEIHKLFDWMDLTRRVKYVKEIDVKVMRPGDNRHFWIKAEGFPPNVIQQARPMILYARVSPGNTITIRSGADKNTIWLSPDFVDFDKRVAVRMGGRQKFNDFLRLDVEAMLEDLRIRGDRQKLYWVKLQFD